MSGPFDHYTGTLTQEIQFLEFMGGSNLPQAFPNYLICLRFIRISTVAQSTVFKMVVAHPFPINSWSELHMVSCSLNPSTAQSASLAWHTLAHKARQEGVITPIPTILRTVIGDTTLHTVDIGGVYYITAYIHVAKVDFCWHCHSLAVWSHGHGEFWTVTWSCDSGCSSEYGTQLLEWLHPGQYFQTVTSGEGWAS